jgi:hypothetical protein
LIKIGQEKWLALRALVANLNAADLAYVELRADVQRLLELPPIPAKARSHMSPGEYWLLAIGKKIRAMKIGQGRRVIRLGDRPYRFQPYRLRLGSEVFIYADSPAKALLSSNRRERGRRMAYWLLDQTLRSGEFSQVRRCRSCPKYFVTTRSDRVSCGPECNVKYQNAQRQSSDDGKLDYFTQKRWEQRKSDVEKAMKLEREGKTPAEIKRLTGLSERVLRKEKSGRGLVALLERHREKG